MYIRVPIRHIFLRHSIEYTVLYTLIYYYLLHITIIIFGLHIIMYYIKSMLIIRPSLSGVKKTNTIGMT